MDIKLIDKEKGIKFKFRVNGILIRNNKVLIVEMNKTGFTCCPGGHVMLGEDTKMAVEREFKEETGIDASVENLFAIVENFFQGKEMDFHELSFFYLLKADEIEEKKQKDFSLVENDRDKIVNMDYRWISLDEIGKYNFQPSIIRDKLEDRNFEIEHIIFYED